MEVLTKMKDLNNNSGFGDVEIEYPLASKLKPKKKMNPNINLNMLTRNQLKTLLTKKRFTWLLMALVALI